MTRCHQPSRHDVRPPLGLSHNRGTFPPATTWEQTSNPCNLKNRQRLGTAAWVAALAHSGFSPCGWFSCRSTRRSDPVTLSRWDVVEPLWDIKLDTLLKGIEGSIWASPCFQPVPGITKVGRSTISKGPVSYMPNSSREREAHQGLAAHEYLCSNLAQAGWQFDVQAMTLRESVHMEGVYCSARDIHQGDPLLELVAHTWARVPLCL